MTSDRAKPIKTADSDRPKAIATDPVAWWIKGCEYDTGCEFEYADLYEGVAEAAAAEGCTVTPLYCSPTLTDAEREAVTEAAEWYGGVEDDERCEQIAATLRNLLKRTPPTQPTPGECSTQGEDTSG